MRTFFKKFQKSVVLGLKILLDFLLFITFFGLMSINNPQLFRISRTAAITMSTFVVIGLLMLAAYGRYDIGKRKSRPIINSVALATVMTDIITYIQLSIMNTNPDNNLHLKFENFWVLILIIVIQIIIIVIFAYGGNHIYFKLNDPEKCCIVTSGKESCEHIIKAVSRFKKQYKIVNIIDYRDRNLHNIVRKCETVFIYDVPVKERTEIVEFCYRHLKNIYFNPEIYDIIETASKHVILDDLSLVSEPVKELSLEQRAIKRLMDIVISVILLGILSPLMLIAAIGIKIDDRGPVFFKQKRATKGGRVFEIYKFRTMKENSDNHSAVDDDDRIT
ncbi:MAG: sugar transferase, partial [Lachnospiraceae bacterium]|nr:sugar transferase [Lachnospiraceae bacterium]